MAHGAPCGPCHPETIPRHVFSKNFAHPSAPSAPQSLPSDAPIPARNAQVHHPFLVKLGVVYCWNYMDLPQKDAEGFLFIRLGCLFVYYSNVFEEVEFTTEN